MVPLDISAYQQALTKHYGKQLLGYIWVAERHESGAVHYHVCVCLSAAAGPMKFADKMGWWSHGWSGTGLIERPSRAYLAKYLQKVKDSPGHFPKGMRIFAATIRCKPELPPIPRFFFKLSAAVGMVRKFVLPLAKAGGIYDGWFWKALQGGGWFVQIGSQMSCVYSEWQLVGVDL